MLHSNLDHARSRLRRYYCPLCGMVALDGKARYINTMLVWFRIDGEIRIAPHGTTSALTGWHGSEQHERITCQGGIATERAP